MILLVPKGEYPHPSGLVQVVDDDAINSMVESFPSGQKLLFDFDHYSDLTNEQREAIDGAHILLPSVAAGWVTKVEPRADGLYGDVDWTPDGSTALRNRSYRFRSPVFPRSGIEVIGEGRVRPRTLSKVALTNEPNMRGMPSLANRGNAEEDDLSGPSVENTANVIEAKPEEKKTMDYKAALLAFLNLPADATDEQIGKAISAKKESDSAMANQVEVAKDEKTALENRAVAAEAELETLAKQALSVKIDATLKKHEGVIANRGDVEAALTKDFEGTLKVLQGLKALPNRADGELPGSHEEDKSKAKPTGLDRVKAAFAGK